LGFFVERQLDVMRGAFIHNGVGAKVFAKELSRLKGGVSGEGKVGHGAVFVFVIFSK
jgi:hypothetical protein